MLTLVDDTGNNRYVVVTQLDYEAAMLTQQGRSERVGIAELTRYWYGENLVLWRPILSASASADLVPGARGESVLWLRDTMQRVFATTLASTDPLLYDDALAEKVREFQRRERLTVDGIVGAQTQIALQTALDEHDVPLLSEAH